MREIFDTWFNVTAKYETENDGGVVVKTTGNYIVKALSFTDAEAKATEELSGYKELRIVKESFAPFNSVLFSDNDKDAKWYAVKVKMISIDDSGKEKKSSIPYLVQASSTASAEKNAKELFDGTTFDYEITNVAETSFIEVYE